MSFPQLEEQAKEIKAIIKTKQGQIEVALFPELAPKAVENFIQHAKEGYYDGVIFHRVIPNFMIQGGDPTGTGRGGESIYGQAFEDEFNLSLFNIKGALSMANAGPNTNGSQFFIVSAGPVDASMVSQLRAGGWPEEIIEAYAEKGGTPWLDHRHTVFGQVREGQEVVSQIENVDRDGQDKPLEDVVIEGIQIIDPESDA
ncbi:peptidylprolyl isomerase [Aerococcus sanguinicola]|uniref:peptidylprolyl isomerase n=1 Tax=unclassified Aerococcus TaxID=2618060 RepID=UPI0008A15A2E|nr:MULTISPECIES: peptidylprolyl isomerase [unclassified Aerococcus]KAB0647820.1 peptidylprolyl isomerase [Aerococcus sanguinicola]MDK6232933.1 peptidylprolyl isomerase [Aerococcus sp. UMB10185]MDK6855227.1 peptidylprolyl isomerase [Aerococcus sp. UMB7533]MDK8502058.1 peptidylprolyl isomerase [Aerococcus sp. UMB1112A]OFN05284.1 peptidylprolyl isomerase [Aerococcus sp. HMSC062A02]